MEIFFILSFSPLSDFFRGYMLGDLVVQDVGENTQGSWLLDTLVLPSLNRFIDIYSPFVVFKMSGRIHRRGDLVTLVLPPMKPKSCILCILAF